MKYYFESIESEICYTEEYFQDILELDHQTEIEVLEAIPEKIPGIFWCKSIGFCGEDSQYTCGKICKSYSPRNGKSGCCRYYSTRLYTHGNKVTINR